MDVEVVTEMRRAMRTGIQDRQRAEKGQHVCAVGRRRTVRIIRCGRVQERPGCAAELLDVERTVWWSVVRRRRRQCCRRRRRRLRWWFPVPERRADLARAPVWPQDRRGRHRFIVGKRVGQLLTSNHHHDDDLACVGGSAQARNRSTLRYGRPDIRRSGRLCDIFSCSRCNRPLQECCKHASLYTKQYIRQPQLQTRAVKCPSGLSYSSSADRPSPGPVLKYP